MIFFVKNWRGYYVRQLMSLDEKARKIIQENSECIVSDESREEVRKFVEKIAEHNYNTEHWRTGKISEKRFVVHDKPDIEYLPKHYVT